jgi:hypothetical protein
MTREWVCHLPPSKLVLRVIYSGGKIMKTLRNLGAEFVLATLKEIQMETLNVLPFVYTF